jgi:signal transduction histidine kinase/CheY-like chemotaxis protein
LKHIFSSFYLVFFLSILAILPVNAQQNQDTIVSKNEPNSQKLQEDLIAILDTVQSTYSSQDFASTIELSQRGRKSSDRRKFYDYYVSFSSNLGNALIQVGDTTRANMVFEESLEKAIAFQEEQSVPKEIKLEPLLTANIDLGNVLALTGKFEQAITKYKKVLELMDDEDIYRIFIINYNIAESLIELKRPNKALSYIKSAEEVSEKFDVPEYDAGLNLLYGKYYYQIEDYQNSIESLKTSIAIAKKVDYVEVLLEAYQFYIESEEKLGHYQVALQVSKELDRLKKKKFESDRLTAVQNARAIFQIDEMQRNMNQELQARKLQAEVKRQEAIRETTLLWSSIALIIAIALIIILAINFRKRKKLNEDLIQKNKIVLQEKKKSDRLLEARNALFSRISHELRTPMYGIVGISNILLEDDEVKPSQKENIQSLKYSADYLLSLINNVLEMNKLNRSSNLSLTKENFDIRELCEHAVESSKYISQNHTNIFKISIDDDIAQTYNGDAVKLMQVLINLLGNANKFTKNGTIELVVKKVGENYNVDHLDFKVIDTGKGITPEKLSEVFDETKFIDHNEANEGTGLGLPISKKILELQDSRFAITSEVGKGTQIEFNLKYEKVKNTPNSIQLIQNDNQTENILQGKTILIVEDNKINQLVTKKIIEGLGGSYEIANNGEEAIDQCRPQSYDLILMDINMPPGMDGFETAREIRKFDTNTPIIALTAVEQLEIEERMKTSDMNDYIIKPFKIDDFKQIIDKYL